MTDTITLPREVAKCALDHIQWFIDNERGGRFIEEREALIALRAALAAPEPEPVAYFDPQGRGFYWAKPTQIDAPTTVGVPHLPLYASPPAAAPSEDIEALRRDAEKWRKAQAKYIAWQKGGKAEAMEDKT